ncbi:helix-turn-helix domain-containing protein [Streptomyces microflavus]|uniref:helix-turn-helix domain-containing protein n=1 Tax=Streptomyces microflavus TaxID=1919 RepID=UPI0033AAD1D6
MSTRLTYPEAAEALRVEESWLRRHIKSLPHSKKGRVVTFSPEDLERIDQLHHAEPEQATSLRTTTGVHALALLKPLPARARRASTG